MLESLLVLHADLLANELSKNTYKNSFVSKVFRLHSVKEKFYSQTRKY